LRSGTVQNVARANNVSKIARETSMGPKSGGLRETLGGEDDAN